MEQQGEDIVEGVEPSNLERDFDYSRVSACIRISGGRGFLLSLERGLIVVGYPNLSTGVWKLDRRYLSRPRMPAAMNESGEKIGNGVGRETISELITDLLNELESEDSKL